MKSRVTEEATARLKGCLGDYHREQMAKSLLRDCQAFFYDQPFQNTSWAAYVKKCGSKNKLVVEIEKTLIEETLEKHKGEKYYSLECNPLASKYDDDIIHTMFYCVFFGVAATVLLHDKLHFWCYELYYNILEKVLVARGISKEKYKQYLKEFYDLGDTWLGEVVFGTSVTVFRDRTLNRVSIRTYSADIQKTLFYIYILMREDINCKNFLFALVVYYLQGRDCTDMPISRALLTASAGITVINDFEANQEDVQKPHCPINSYPLCLDITTSNPMFPCYKFKFLPRGDVKSRYLFYWQNLNTDNNTHTVKQNLKGTMPIDQDDYEFFKTVVCSGFSMMTQTLYNDLVDIIERLHSLSVVTKEASTQQTQLKEYVDKANRFEQENVVLKRSLHKLKGRYNTLEAENRHLKEQAKALTDSQKTIAQAEGIIAIDQQKTAQLQQLQNKLAKSKARITTLEQQAGDTSALELELARLRQQLHNERALNAELLKDVDNLEASQATKSEQLTQEERDLLAKARVLLILPDFPSLKELKRIMPNSTFTFIPNDRSVVLTPAPSVDFCLYSTKMTSHGYFYKLKQMYKTTPDKLVCAHTIGNLAICRIVLTKCYEFGIDKLNR